MGISWPTWAKHRDNPGLEVFEALKRGEAAAIGVIESALYKSAAEGNLGAQVFFLKNRTGGKWRDKTEQVIAMTAPAELLDDDALAAIAAGSGQRVTKAQGTT